MRRSKRSTVDSRQFIAYFLLPALVCLLISCSNDPKFRQYYVQGEQLYVKNCSNCHQKNGKGLGLVYPPVDQSDYIDKNFEAVLCLMKYGTKGELIVNGKTFNQPMPGIPTLTDLEIAEIATYLYNNWDRKHGLIDVKEVTPLIEKCIR
jgi:cytochrome c551